MRLIVIGMSMAMCSGCVSLATNIATQASMHYIGQQYAILQDKPIVKCSLYNVIKGNKTCRVYRRYKIKESV